MFLAFANQGLIDIFFADEASFSGEPYIPYRWGKKGEQIGIPSTKKIASKVLGFLNPITQQLITYQLSDEDNMNSELFIKFINDLVDKITKPTVLILDNASWHKSKATMAMLNQWQEKGLFLYFLPVASPHLNLIEILWRQIKYKWLFCKDYRSEKTLKKKLNLIFKTYGKDFYIDFSMNILKNFNIKSIL